MISKPENIHCMTTTTTDGGSICVKVMRQLRCRWWWHWWKEPEGTITSPRARWANHPPAPEITGSVALKCIVLNCVAVWPVFDALAAPWAGAWQLQRVTGNECSREVSGRELVLGTAKLADLTQGATEVNSEAPWVTGGDLPLMRPKVEDKNFFYRFSSTFVLLNPLQINPFLFIQNINFLWAKSKC